MAWIYFPTRCVHYVQNNFYNKSIRIFHVYKYREWQAFYMFILFMVTVWFMSDFLYDGDYEHTSIFQS